MYGEIATIIKLGILVALPVLIVWLVSREKQNRTNRMTEVMLKAIESGTKVDADFFKNGIVRKSVKQSQMNRFTAASITTSLGVVLLVGGIVLCYIYNGEGALELFPITGGILFAVGIGLFIAYFVGKKMLAKEIEAEEKSLKEDK